MVTVARRTDASPDRVLAVLRDASAYPRWVVGTRALVDVEDGWPNPGTAFVHQVGVGPLHVQDRTTLVEARPDGVVLDARAQPMGRARVDVRVTTDPDGVTRLILAEEPVSGGARLIPRPLLDPATRLRNRRSLARLISLAESSDAPARPS